MPLCRVIIFAKDIRSLAAFYRDRLGLLPRSEPSPDWVELEGGGVGVALHSIPREIAAGIEVTTPPEARESTAVKLVFEVRDLVAARARLVSHGITMYDVQPWGACDGLDPEGNVFQLVEQAPQGVA